MQHQLLDKAQKFMKKLKCLKPVLEKSRLPHPTI
jgi:hypothetical protein